MLLEGKVVLITGAAWGIGRVALIMAEEGVDGGVADILPEVEDMAREVQKKGRRSTAGIFNILDPINVHEGAQKTWKELGYIDLLVNNAGIVNNTEGL